MNGERQVGDLGDGVFEGACPYLGLPQDPDTNLSYPHRGNYCHAYDVAERVDLLYQSGTCLGRTWAAFQRYRLAADGLPLTTVVATARERRTRQRRLVAKWGLVVAAIAVVAALLVILWPTASDDPVSTIVDGQATQSHTASEMEPGGDGGIEPNQCTNGSAPACGDGQANP
jgi:hypothetical protein